MKYTDLVFANEDEADAYARLERFNKNYTRHDIAIALAKWPKVNDRPRIAVVT